MQSAKWCSDWEGHVGPFEDPLQVAAIYLNFNVSFLSSPKHHDWNCTKVYIGNISDKEIQRMGPVA